MRLSRHEFLVQVVHCQISTACNGWLCRWTRFEDRGATLLRTYGQERNMPFIRMDAEASYKLLFTSMLLRTRRSILDGDSQQDLILPHVDLWCFDYPFPSASFSARGEHFQSFLNIEHRFWESTSFLSIFVSWNCVEPYLIPSQNCGRFYILVDCSEWRGLKTNRALSVPNSPVLSYYSNWVFEGSFRHLFFTVARR